MEHGECDCTITFAVSFSVTVKFQMLGVPVCVCVCVSVVCGSHSASKIVDVNFQLPVTPIKFQTLSDPGGPTTNRTHHLWHPQFLMLGHPRRV